MKITRCLIAVVCSVALSSFSVRAHDGDGDKGGGDGGGGDETSQGGQIDGSETLIASVDLVPTTNAPSGAGGFAKLISDNEEGLVTSSLSMTITGLDAGVYTITIVKKSDGTTVDLGQVDIGNTGDSEGDDEEGDGEKCSGVSIDEQDLQLPDGLDPLDIAQIIVTDSNGNVVLVGDLVTPAGTTLVKFKAKLKVASGNVTLQTTGTAQASSTAKRGRRTDRFTMIASGVAPSTTFTVTVNGQNAGTVKSNGKGKVLVRKLPANLLAVRSVHLVDPTGQTAVKAKF
jgi:hypothetical protein